MPMPKVTSTTTGCEVEHSGVDRKTGILELYTIDS
jgi:hypothetical protein